MEPGFVWKGGISHTFLKIGNVDSSKVLGRSKCPYQASFLGQILSSKVKAKKI